MKSIQFCFLLFMLLFFPNSVFAQEIIIHGKVLDMNTHREISSVNIFIKGTQIGTTSDFAGRFSLTITKPRSDMIIVFQHIAYDIREMTLDSIKTLQTIYLQPRVIPLPGVRVEALGEIREINKDLPQSISVIKSDYFEIRGFTDAGDLINTDHSVQVTEEMSGKKTIAIRGGNPDGVVVLYNGIKMNSAFDNIFDLSLIDLEDVERLEIIKGSNAALYGSDALAGTVNIVSKVERDYHIRFQQRIGTYNSGTWGIQLYQNLHGLHASYSFSQGATKRQFSNASSNNDLLKNRASHHTANLVYHFSKSSDGSRKNSLSVMYIRSSLDYDNLRDLEWLSNLNQVVLLKYDGDIYKLENLSLSGSYHQLHETRSLVYPIYFARINSYRKIYDDAFYFNVEKRLVLRGMEWLLAYQFENVELDFQDRDFDYSPIELHYAPFHRWHHGVAAISKLHASTGFNFMSAMDFDLSLRRDKVTDKQKEGDTHIWDETMLKFSTNLNGNRGDLLFNVFMNYGTNVKFPTLYQQISLPVRDGPVATSPNLNPEKNLSTEVGVEITKNIQGHPTIYGWQFSGSFFKNYYANKFRSFYIPGIPIAYYDNVPDAHISGLETKSGIFLFRKKVTIEVGISRYFISEKEAFPFKYESKATLDLGIDHAGYGFLLHLFKEGEQVVWIRRNAWSYTETALPGRTDLDIYLDKTFRLGKFKFLTNASVRNLLNNDVELSGLALRDRRVYLTVGVQY